MLEIVERLKRKSPTSPMHQTTKLKPQGQYTPRSTSAAYPGSTESLTRTVASQIRSHRRQGSGAAQSDHDVASRQASHAFGKKEGHKDVRDNRNWRLEHVAEEMILVGTTKTTRYMQRNIYPPQP
jgi:hypothetical protein